jgi:DNA-binding LacI/PurR family transcriptional regulator
MVILSVALLRSNSRNRNPSRLATYPFACLLAQRMAEMTVPPLTNIDFPYTTMGYMGAELLIRQLEGEIVTVQELLKPPLTVRHSSSPCR